MSRTTQGILGTIITAAFLALHWAGLLALPPEVVGTFLVALVASLGLGAHGYSRRSDPRPGAHPEGRPKGFASVLTLGALLAMAFIICLVVGGCAATVCKNIAVDRYPAPEHGPNAKLVVQKCGDRTTEWIVVNGTPECMEGCWKPAEE